MKRRIALIAATAAMAITSAIPAQAATLTDGQTYGAWNVVFAGYGSVEATGSGSTTSLRLAPKAATAPENTHAALVVSTRSYTGVALKTRVTLNKQLRVNSAANPWETGWLLTRYTDNDHFYYLALKTNGWELGKRDPAYPGGQRFLATGDSPRAAVGSSQTATLRVKGKTLTVTIGGTRVASFTDNERPYTSGKVGFYTEDADVTFDRITTTAL